MTPLVLLPGMMCDRRLFEPQIAAVSPGRSVVVGDLTGADTVQDLATQVLAQAPARFALAGLSMGGIVAMEVLRQAPDRVAGLALLDTNPLAEQPEVKARRGPQMAKVRAGLLDQVMREELKPNYLAAGGKTHAEILDLCMAMARTLGPEVFLRQSVALRDRPDQQATLAAVEVPSLILCGAEDRLCPPDRHRLMHRLIPAATLVMVARAGHLPTLEQPAPVTAAMADWLGQVDLPLGDALSARKAPSPGNPD
ncbi:Hydrolase, alpha/beta hydrolase fold protein family [Roseibacterium elongatum DSM 19469]|uniref:Hydrolase, alpha/beta hydrolase fold protein family n=1 Tax=Roseicyclus elongatus DSM 19469 TaxID=1294273 RepID=W8RX80_9RHOB|nr:alpha/beta fold hydrolase [Roseibacterium elongatum]AHM05824.1 Hydrolase, alpha/beta hydrolase fold protein family [Roseibacterium elongatum DSM 19469]